MTFARMLGLAIICSVLGCGLADYQARMDIEKKRMTIFDNEDKYLDYPIMPPTYIVPKKNEKEKDKEVPAWQGFDVFVRVPKEYDYKEKDSTLGGKVYLFRYPGPTGFNFFVAASKIGVAKDGDFLPGELSVDEFRKKVPQAIREFHRKHHGSDLSLPQAPPAEEGKKSDMYKKMTIQPEGARDNPPALTYELLELPGPKAKDKESKETHFKVYFHQHNIHQVALVYQAPKKDVNSDDFEKKLDWSLKSLDPTEKAGEKRLNFLAARKNSPPPSPPQQKKDKDK